MSKENLKVMYNQAITFAMLVHRDQTDKGNVSYIDHPFQIASMFARDDYHGRLLAILHDTIEDFPMGDGKDQPIVIKSLKESIPSFPDEILEQLLVLTRQKDHNYEQYIDKIIEYGDPIVMKVKYFDLLVNYDHSRIGNANMSDKDIKRKMKYKETIKKMKLAFLEKDFGIPLPYSPVITFGQLYCESPV